MWYTIEGAALLAFIEKTVILIPLAAYTPRAPANTEASAGIFLLRSCRGGINLPPCDARLASGHGSTSLGTYDAPKSCMPLKLIDTTPLLRYAQFFLRGQRVANH